MLQEHRTKIKNSKILSALIGFVEGRKELSAAQVTAALGLLRKVMPDLAAVQHSGEISTRRATEIGDDELAHIAAGSGNGAAEAPEHPAKLN